MDGTPTPGALTDPPPQKATVSARLFLGIVILVASAILIYLLFAFWPVPQGDPVANAELARCGVPASSPTPAPNAEPNVNPGWVPCVEFLRLSFPISADLRLLLIVAIAAALGSLVQIATSFSTFVGNRTFAANWTWWYILRAPIGIALAFIFYFAVRGGIITPSGNTANINVFGIAALAGLVGLFSKQASDKLEETFKTLFRTAPGVGDDQRTGKLAKPQIAAVTPTTAVAGSPALAVRIQGRGFDPKATVRVNGTARTTTYASETQIVGALTAADLQAAGTLQITVANPDNTISDQVAFVVSAPAQ